MNTGEKVARYLQERKSPVSMQDIAYHFLLATSTVGKALRSLEREGKVVRSYKDKSALWAWRRTAMALPRDTHTTQPRTPAPTYGPAIKIKTSYPHIRGYED